MKLKSLYILIILLYSFSTFAQQITTDTTLASALLKEGINLIDSSKNTIAIEKLNKAASLYDKHEIWEKYLYCRQQEALVNRFMKNYSKSEQIILKAINRTNGKIDSLGVNLAYSYWTLARAYQMLDKNKKALEYFNHSLKILIKKGEPEYVSVADLYWFRGNIFRTMKEYQKAVYEFNDALRFAKKVTPPNKGFIARIYYKLALNYDKLKQFNEALNAYNKCIETNKGVENNQIYTGWSYDNSAFIYGHLNQPDQQIEYNLKAIEVYEKLKGENYKYIGYCYENIALAFEKNGKYDSAIIFRKKAIKIEKHNNAVQDLAYNYYRIGYDFHSLGIADSALKYYNLHFTEIEKTKPTLNTAYAYFNVGQLQFKAQPEKAIGNYKKSYRLKLKFYDVNNMYLAEDLEKIIYVYKQLNQTDSVIRYSKIVLKLYENNIQNNKQALADAADKSFQIAYDYHDHLNDSAISYYLKHNIIAKKMEVGFHHRTPYSYFNLGNIYYGRNQYGKAAENLQKSLNYRDSTNTSHKQFANNYKMLGFSYRDFNLYDSAIINLKKSVYYYLLAKDTISAIERYFNIGYSYQAIEEYDSTIHYYQKFIDGTESYPEKEFINKKHVQNNLANLYYQKEDYKRAAILHKKTIKEKKVHLGVYNISLYGNYNDLGNCLRFNEQFDSAITCYKKGLLILVKQKEPDTISLMSSYRNLGISFKRKKEYDSTFYYYRKALRLGFDYDSLHFKTADTYRYLGIIFQDLEEYDSAMYYMDKYTNLVKKTGNHERIETAHNYNNYGIIYDYKEQYDTAIEFYNLALSLYQKLEGNNSKNVALVLRNLGLTHRYSEELDSALIYFNKALAIYQQNDNGINSGASDAIFDIAVVYKFKNEFNKAAKYYLKAIELSKKVYGKTHPEVARKISLTALNYIRKNDFDSALFYYKRANHIYNQIGDETNFEYAKNHKKIGTIYIYKVQPDSAIKHLKIAKAMFNEHFPDRKDEDIDFYYNMSRAYHYADKYYEAIKWIKKAIETAEKHPLKYPVKLAEVYGQMGVYLNEIAEHEKSLKHHQKALAIKQKQKKQDDYAIAISYQSIGVSYAYMKEYHLALEYYTNSLNILKKRKVQPFKMISVLYSNIGHCYDNLRENEKAIAYFEKCIETLNKTTGKTNTTIADNLKNIGGVYFNMEQYEKALEYVEKAEQIYIELGFKKSLGMGIIYSFMATIYQDTEQYDKALEYHKKSYEIEKKVYLGKHHFLALLNSNIAALYYRKKEFEKTIEYAHKSLCDNLRDYNDTSNIYFCPPATNFTSWREALNAYQKKALAFHELVYNKRQFELLPYSLEHFMACDTILNEARKEMKTKADKIQIGRKAYDLYDDAILLCRNSAYYVDSLSNTGLRTDKKLAKKLNKSYLDLSFNFSEKNKSSVLLESLAGAEAQKFAGIPDKLLEKEKQLSTSIAQFKKLIAEGESNEYTENELFNANRSYDSLMLVFENKFPKYHELKYNQQPLSIKQITKALDKETAIISYFTGYSTIYIYLISKDVKQLYYIDKIKGFNEKIDTIRNYISNTSLLAKEVKNNSNISVKAFKRLAFEFYNQLFTKKLKKDLAKTEIKNLVIIPDGKIATIPFEALLTEDYQNKWEGWKNKKYFSEMPFLIKKYNISYSYSANLYYQTFLRKSKKQSEIEITDLNDWLALAPVFDDENISGTTLRTRQMLEKATTDSAGIAGTRAFLRDGTYISALPGSEIEIKEIFNLFEQNNKKALLKTHNQANEEFIKSGELEKYKYLHLATHGIVNADKPELSAVLLAQTNSDTEDNILYSGELYNLKLSAELTVLSACETGLGKIAEGEGVIGLTRALLYAGSKNIIVSLWQVSDASTKELMINFYSDLLNKNSNTFSKPLRHAKLKLIQEGKYAHPFFWSPFILIGR